MIRQHWGAGNGLVPSGHKPLPEPVLTRIYVGNYSQWMPQNLTNETLPLLRIMAWRLQAISYYQIYVAMTFWGHNQLNYYNDVIMGVMASQTTSFTIVYSTVYLGADQRKHQSFASLAFVQGIHRWPVNSPHKWPVTRKMAPFDDVIMYKNTYFAPAWEFPRCFHFPRPTVEEVRHAVPLENDSCVQSPTDREDLHH